MAEELMEDRVKKLERALESLAEVPKQLTRLGERVEKVEDLVTNVESQISQLWTEMRGGFSAANRELVETRAAILEVIDSSSKATQKLYDDGRDEMRKLFGDLKGVLKEDIAEARTDMRVLHEDLVERIKVLGKA